MVVGGCADEAEPEAVRSGPTTTTVEEPSECVEPATFEALSRVTRRQALCPRTLDGELSLRSIYAYSSPAAYVVEFENEDDVAQHLVLELTEQDPPGVRVAMRQWEGKQVEVFFAAARPGEPAGLHSGHYLAVVPSSAGRGSYWLSTHGSSALSQQQNVDQVMLLLRDSSFVGN